MKQPWTPLGLAVILLFICLQRAMAKPKVMFINSYHADYAWSAGIIEGAAEELGIEIGEEGSFDTSNSPVEFKLVNMDTKRNTDEAFIKQAALRAKKAIEAWNPDVTIVADDNAFKYLVMPFYKNHERPFVFCGINWDASHYEGAPYSNTAGMMEVALFQPLIKQLSAYAKGPRIGFLAGDRYSDRAEADYARKLLNIKIEKEYYVTNFEEWKVAFKNLQTEVDMIIWTAIAGIENWDRSAAKRWVMNEAKIPFGTVNEWMMPYQLLGVTKVPQEQGAWAAKTALRILKGTKPGNIPVVKNKKACLHLNMKVAKRMGIRFPMNLIENAHLISARPQKIFLVNSYHEGYRWSDDLEKSFLKALAITRKPDGSLDTTRSSVKLKVFRMNSKLNQSPDYLKKVAREANDIIEEWKPDLVVACDDNASKYLVVPYLKNSSTPVIFCGINWDGSIYGFPTETITGMIEVAPYQQTIKMLKHYAKGDRMGLIGANEFSNHKELTYLNKMIHIDDDNIKLASTFAEWKESYVALQQAVDMVLLLNPIGIQGWNEAEALELIMNETLKPSGSISTEAAQYSLFGYTKFAEEQGWWAGQTALDILDGVRPADIPVATNQQNRLYLNMNLAKKLGIRFPVEQVQEAFLVQELNQE